MNKVKRENNAVLNKTIVYNYDAGGNITSKIEYPYTTGTLGVAAKTVNYGYGDSNWKDKLTSYDGKSISYDPIGNPLNDRNYNYTWEEGRQLSGISGNGKTITYKYNDAGIRTQKVVNGVTTNYHLEGDNVTYESNGTDKIYYTYDSEGDLLSMNLNGTEYYYIRNAQGDIIGLFDKNGAAVASYTYDTWGKLISIKDSSGTDITNNTASVGYKNAYRYRGYRYDTETGLYYLNARYYNAEWGRFINADAYGGSVGNLLSHNAFGYCMNNPVNMSDPSGNWPSFSDIIQGAKNIVNTIVNVVNTVVNVVKSVVATVVSKVSTGKSSSKNVSNVSSVTGSPGGAATLTAGDSYIATKVVQQWNKNIFVPQNLSRAVEGGLGTLYVASKVTKAFGAFAVLGFGVGVWDNFANYKHGAARTAVDVVVFGGCSLIGIGVAAVGAPVLAGVGVCILGAAGLTYAGNAIKDRWINDPK